MRFLCSFFAALSAAVSLAQSVEGVTLASEPSNVYVSARDSARALAWPMEYDAAVELVKLNGVTLDPKRPQLSDGTWLISLQELGRLGASVSGMEVAANGKHFIVTVGPKRVAVDLKKQRLRAWQGSRVIYDVPVSTGREGKDTPNGDFRALDKERLHISKLYGSPMPFSVHIIGNIYIHGSPYFSSAPGSHGCIRLQLIARRNVAEEFYDWIDVGTPIKVTGAFPFRKG